MGITDHSDERGKLFKPDDSYLVRRLVPFKFNVPQVISTVSYSVMSNVLGLIAATTPAMTAGIPTRLKLYVIGFVAATSG